MCGRKLEILANLASLSPVGWMLVISFFGSNQMWPMLDHISLFVRVVLIGCGLFRPKVLNLALAWLTSKFSKFTELEFSKFTRLPYPS